MGMWVKQLEDNNLPAWLTENLSSTCKCGGDIENFYNDDNKLTSRRCSNSECPYHLAQRVVKMCDILGIVGIGPETALQIVRTNKLTNTYEAIPYVTGGVKPSISLYDYLRISCTQGIDTGWKDVAATCKTLDDCYTKYTGELQYILMEMKDMLYKGLEHVQLQVPTQMKYKPIITGTVMISGTIRGFAERNHFIYSINRASQGLIAIGIAEGKKKNGVMALIQEADTPNRGKAECALENGIPIMTPEAFQTKMLEDLAAAIQVTKVEPL